MMLSLTNNFLDQTKYLNLKLKPQSERKSQMSYLDQQRQKKLFEDALLKKKHNDLNEKQKVTLF